MDTPDYPRKDLDTALAGLNPREHPGREDPLLGGQSPQPFLGRPQPLRPGGLARKAERPAGQAQGTISTPIRAFIGVDAPDQAKNALSALVETLTGLGLRNVRWVRPEGIHLTLKFLGNTGPDLVPRILDALEESSRGLAAFDLGLADLGVFPGIANPKVLWVGLRGDLEELKELQQRAEAHLEHLGFPADARGFSPHLTLGRARADLSPKQRRQMGEALRKVAPVSSVEWRVREVHLIQSTLTPEGAVYRRLGTLPMEG